MHGQNEGSERSDRHARTLRPPHHAQWGHATDSWTSPLFSPLPADRVVESALRCAVVWCGAVQCGAEMCVYGMVWYGLVWYGTVQIASIMPGSGEVDETRRVYVYVYSSSTSTHLM